MLDNLSESFGKVFKVLSGNSKITRGNIEDAISKIRPALLEADVSYNVVNTLITRIQNKALGTEVLSDVNPSQQFINIVQKELTSIMGEQNSAPTFNGPLDIVLVVGLNGQGKTSFVSKLAYLFKDKKKILAIPADTYRPAAKDQLITLLGKIGVDYFDSNLKNSPEKIAEEGISFAKKNQYDLVIIDTSGRIHLDKDLMKELYRVKKRVKPNISVLVVDAMIGSRVTDVVTSFNTEIGIDGIVLTKLDSDTRGGAALSIKEVTGLPIYYSATGERPSDLELFHPERMASRILDMGDVVTLVEKAQTLSTKEDNEKMMAKVAAGKFSMTDFVEQMGLINKMGDFQFLLKMIPGGSKLLQNKEQFNLATKEITDARVIIDSMTKFERDNYKLIDKSRRRRIAKGSGKNEREVDDFIKKFGQMSELMAGMTRLGNRDMNTAKSTKPKNKSPWGKSYF